MALENLVIKGIITATSNKKSDKFENQVNRKQVYFTVDEETAKKLEEFGLRKYTSYDKEDFFIVRTSKNVSRYEGGKLVEEILCENTDSEFTPNFNSDGKVVGLNLIKGESDYGKYWIRLSAIDGELEVVERTNPFE